MMMMMVMGSNRPLSNNTAEEVIITTIVSDHSESQHFAASRVLLAGTGRKMSLEIYRQKQMRLSVGGGMF